MRNKLLLLFLLPLTLTACGPQTVPQSLPTAPATNAPQVITPTPVIATATAEGDASTENESASAEDLEIAYNEDMFTPMKICQTCHTGLVDEAGNDVSNVSDWAASMMAHAAVDPYYKATVNAEVLRHPEYAAAIEDKCTTCHMPMAHFAVHAEGGTSTMLGKNGYENPAHPLHERATEAISCTVCHQIQPDNFGQESSFSGNLLFDTTTPKGERTLYGPYPAKNRFVGIMQAGSGYIIEQSDHLAQAEMCATCHSLHTHYLLEDGTLSEQSTFPEQTPYEEWLASDYAKTQSCQDCHMPQAEGAVAISIMGSPPRSPFYLHTFTGGNAYMLNILKNFSDEIPAQTDAAGFEESIQRTEDLLTEQTATLKIDSAQLNGDQLNIDVSLVTLTGHKFPSGFPSRRAWIHLTVVDAGGQPLFESGAYEPNGSILGNANDEDGTTFEPHYTEITSPDQVQIYESIMQDVSGNVTTALLQAETYIKDNRLLPSGFDKASASTEIAVHGAAAEDGDFLGAGDTVHYGIKLDAASAPLTVNVALLYQSIGYRWAQNLGQQPNPAVDDFLRYYDETPNIPVVIARQEITVNP